MSSLVGDLLFSFTTAAFTLPLWKQIRGDAPEEGKHLWKNWAGNLKIQVPKEMYHEPKNVREVQNIVREAYDKGFCVKVVGHGHSWSSIHLAEANEAKKGHIMSLKQMNKLLSVDKEIGFADVEAGILLSDLNDELEKFRVAIPLIASISSSELAGTFQTGTHSTGSKYPVLASHIIEMDVIDGKGELITVNKDHPYFKFIAVGLGALGIIVRFRIKVVPMFEMKLRAFSEPLDSVVKNLDSYLSKHDHVKLWMVHFAGKAKVFLWDRVELASNEQQPDSDNENISAKAKNNVETLSVRNSWKLWLRDVVLAQYVVPLQLSLTSWVGQSSISLINKITLDTVASPKQARSIPAEEVAKHCGQNNDYWIIIEDKVYDVTNFMKEHPGGAKILKKMGGKDATSEFEMYHKPGVLNTVAKQYCIGVLTDGKYDGEENTADVQQDRPDAVVNVPFIPIHSEMELCVPVQFAKDIMLQLEELITKNNLPANFLTEIRFTSEDDFPMSPSTGRKSVWINCLIYGSKSVVDNYYEKIRNMIETITNKNVRPHWGKIHTYDASHLKDRYPQFEEFLNVRKQLDPRNVFMNEYLYKVLGIEKQESSQVIVSKL